MDLFPLSLWPFFKKKFSHLSIDATTIDDVAIDSRTLKGNRALFIALKGRRGDGHMYVEEALQKGARFALVSEHWVAPSNIPEERLIRTKNTLDALQELASVVRSHRAPSQPVVMITGCCGKTMLKDMLQHVLVDVHGLYASPESYNSQIGVSLSLLNIPIHNSISFIEVAANKPGEMQRLLTMVRPTHIIITNFFRPRYGLHEHMNPLLKEFREIFEYHAQWILLEEGHITASSQQLYFWNRPKKEIPHVTTFQTTSTGIVLDCMRPEGNRHCKIASFHTFMVDLVTITLQTCHLLQNTTKIHSDAVINALQGYRPQTMRTEVWKNSIGVTFMNGTYSHEPLSFATSLEEMTFFLRDAPQQQKRLFVFGGLKESFFDIKHRQHITDAIQRLHISDVLLWPETSAHFLDETYARKHHISLHSCSSREDALEKVQNFLQGPIQVDAVVFKGAEKLQLHTLFEALESSPPQTCLSINLASLRHNIDLLKTHLGPSIRIMIMVKALAYGTDDIRIAHFLRKCGIDILGVSYVHEGMSLRQKGVTQDIFVINASDEEMEKAFIWRLEIGVGSATQILAARHAVERVWKKRATRERLKVHLHVDTGMKRFGCHAHEAQALAQLIDEQKEFLEFEGLFTHFCAADNPDHDTYTKWQFEQLQEIHAALISIGICPRHLHAANSAAAIRCEITGSSMVRIGLATYGIYTSHALKQHLPYLRPALSLITKISGLNKAYRGDTVGYSRSYTVEKEQALIAVLPIGYHDGLHRIYSGKTEVLVRGKKAPIIGKICMDYMMIDVSEIPAVGIGDSVLIFGEDEFGNTIPIEECAERGGSIAHELMTCLGPRIQRIFLYDESLRTR